MRGFKMTDQEVNQVLAPVRAYGLDVNDILDTMECYMRASHVFSAFKVQLSVPFKAAPLPASIERGEMRMCYQNASLLAMYRDDLTYVEGFAHCGLIPVEHAWCVDAQGNVIDPTWDNPEECQYLGVPFKTDFLEESLHAQGMYGIFGGMQPYSALCRPIEEIVAEPWLAEVSARPRIPAIDAMIEHISTHSNNREHGTKPATTS